MSAVTASIAFLNSEWKDADDMARIYSRETRHANTTKHDIDIHNARPLAEAGKLDLDRNGFTLMKHTATFENFEDKKAIEREYFEEMRRFMLGVCADAVDAVPFPFYQLRSRRPANFFDAFSLYMHCDFSLNSWEEMAQNLLKQQGRGDRYSPEEYDFALYNLWRPIYHAAEQSPLTVVDASTMNLSLIHI